MKKLIKIIRNLIIFILWTIVFFYISTIIFSLVWNFDISSAHSWNIIKNYWNTGGVFKTPSDIMLLISLILIPIIYIIGLKKIQKINFLKLFLSPINYFYNKEIKDPERVVIKGIKSVQQIVDDVKNEIESLKPKKTLEAGSIRSNIIKKINEEIKN